MISKPIQVRTFSSDIQVDKTLITHHAVAHSKECQLRWFLLYAHLINVLSSAAVNHIIQTPVPTTLNEPRTVDACLNISPISTLDPPTPMSRNAQQEPASEPIDIEVPLPLPPLREVHLPATRVPETMLDPSSQAEVEAITNSTHPGGLSSMGPVPEGVTLAPDNTLPGAALMSDNPPMIQDVGMMDIHEDVKGDDDASTAPP